MIIQNKLFVVYFIRLCNFKQYNFLFFVIFTTFAFLYLFLCSKILRYSFRPTPMCTLSEPSQKVLLARLISISASLILFEDLPKYKFRKLRINICVSIFIVVVSATQKQTKSVLLIRGNCQLDKQEQSSESS